MYNPKNKQFVFKDSNGRLWNFFFDINQGICYSIYTKKMSWSEPRTIQAEAHEQFYADIDANDCFHLVYQDKKGNIIYCLMQQNETVKAIPVLTSKSHSLTNNYLSLIVAKNCVHIFFIIEHNGTYMLSFQTLTEGVPVAPKKVDNIAALQNPYSVIYDLNDEIYAFYHISDGTNNQIGYKKYSITSKVWSEYCQITTFSINSENPKILVDRNGIFHICYRRKLDKQNQLIYQQKIPDRNMWTSESILLSTNTTINHFSMLSIKSSLIVYYLRDEILFPYISEDLGIRFTKPTKGIPLSKQYICVQYKSNSPYEHVQAAEIPATFVNGFRLMFSNESVDPESGLNTDEMKAIIITDLKQLKKEVDQLKETQKTLFENINFLSAAQQNLQQNLQKEIAKLVIGINSVRKPSPDETLQPKKNIQGNQDSQDDKKQIHTSNTQTRKTVSLSSLPTTREEMIHLFADRKKKKARINKDFKGVWKLKRRKNR